MGTGGGPGDDSRSRGMDAVQDGAARIVQTARDYDVLQTAMRNFGGIGRKGPKDHRTVYGKQLFRNIRIKEYREWKKREK